MNDPALTRFFGVLTRPQAWLGIVFHVLAFPLGLCYFVFLVTGLSVGIGLVVVWVGIPILLVVAGAWWLLAAFERVQARYLLGADLAPAPRPWEKADGVWGKLKAHFGSGCTWRDLAYLFAKFPLGLVSFLLLVTLASILGSLFAVPVFTAYDVPVFNGTWVPPLWFAALCVPLGLFALVVALHVVNAWSWVCARWAEIVLGETAPAASVAVPPGAPAPPSGAPVPEPAPPSGARSPVPAPPVGAQAPPRDEAGS